MQLQDRNMRLGMQGEDVRLLQTELQQLGYHLAEEKLDQDRFDEVTRQVVLDFQSKHDLEPTGVVDERTARAVNWAVERLTPDDVHHMDGGQFTMDNFRLRRAMSMALARAPAVVVEDLMDDCFMLMPEIEGKGEYVPAELLKDKGLILFPEALLELDWEEIEYTILHEVVHYTLGDTSPILDWDLDYDAQEEEADALVQRWLSRAQEVEEE